MLDKVEILPVDREALAEDIWQSIPQYMHKSIERAFARHRLRYDISYVLGLDISTGPSAEQTLRAEQVAL